MAVYAIGDVQGCSDELQELLDTLNIEPATDQVWFVGDLVNRGPKSLQTLRLVRSLGNSAITVLGNHDLHLLALALASDVPEPDACLRPVLEAADRNELTEWLRCRPLVHHDRTLKTVMVHAGIVAEWTVDECLSHAAEVESVLQGDHPERFFNQMYGEKPTRWSANLSGIERQRFIVNSCTRMRYYNRDGSLNFASKLAPADYAGHGDNGLIPWFRVPKRKSATTRIVFGHWSTLGYINEANVIGLDTGCVWGGKLSAARLDEPAPLVQVNSRQAKAF